MEKILSAVVALLLLSLPFQHAHASPAHVPQTGQTICYDQFGNSINCTGTGQDGETRTGIAWPNPRFRDNGLVDSADQTMTDMLTGLAWAKNANAASAPKTWQQALDYVNSLNDQNYLGHSDWRLPNVNELSSISGQQGSNGAWLTGQGFVNIQAGFYWSSTSSASTPSTAWIVDIANGNINGTYKTTPLYVWPVRSDATGAAALLLARTGQTGCWNTSGTGRSCAGTGEDGELQAGAAWPTPRFAAGTDETITDTLTGLTWSGNAAPSAVPTWQQALQHIATLNSDNYLGHTDWRLPNVNELSSLFDFQQGNAAAWLAAQGFVNVQTGNYWTSTSYADAPRFAWYVYMASGGSDYDRKATPNDAYYVWPVRGGFTGSVVHLGVAREGSGSGTVTPDTGSIAWKGTNGTGDYTRGSVVTLTATPDMGSAFAGWSGACSGPGSCMVTLDEARSVTATFVTPTILPSPWNFGDVAVYTEARKAFTISNNGLSPLSVTAITITGTNPTQFGIIPGNCATLPPASSCTVDVTFYPTTQGPKNALLHVTTDSAANPVLEAQLSGIGIIPYYALSVNTEGTGSGRVYFSSGGSCSGGCSQPFAANRLLQLTPLADSGSRFSGWSGCDSVSGETCTVTMTDAKSVTASFSLAPSFVEQWTGGIPAGAVITALAASPGSPATLFAAVGDGNGIYRSDDGGSTWNPGNGGLTDTDIASLAVIPTTPPTIFADTANGGLFRSDDGGGTWTLLNGELTGAKALVARPGSVSVLYASGCGGICKSTDGGATWNAANTGLTSAGLTTAVTDLAINPVTPDTLYAAAQGGPGMYGGFFRSTDGGDTWVLLETTHPYGAKTPVAVDPVTPGTLYMGTSGGGMYKSMDAGTTWRSISNGIGNLSVKAIAITPGATSTLYAATESGVFRSTDGGETWNALNNGLTFADVNAIVVDPQSPSVAYAATNGGGVFRLALVLGVPALAVTPSSAGFGSVATFSSSSTVPFTLTNTGNADLYVTSVSLGGNNPGDFALQPGTCPSLAPVLTPGARCTVEVTFLPTSIGAKGASLLVSSSDPVTPASAVALTGTAYDPAPVGLVTINSGAGFTAATAVTLSIAAFDNSGTVAEMRFSNNNSSWGSWEMYGTTREWTLTALGGDGAKTVYVQFRDAAGNASGSFADSITLDTTPPVTTIGSMPGPFYPSNQGTFSFSASESATFQCRFDGGPASPCTSPFSFSGLADGTHTFAVQATDLAGNREAAEKTYTFTIDTSGPETTLTGQPAILSGSAGGSFTFSSPDTFITFHCRMDGGSWSHCGSPFTFTGLADGPHTFSVKAIDRAGNSDTTPATFSWTIDTTPPDTVLTSIVSGSSATFTIGSNETASSLQCALDGASWSPCGGAVALDGLAPGTHSFSARAVDPAGNIDPTPATFTWSTSCDVRDSGGTCYATITDALAAIPDGETLRLKAARYTEDVALALPKTIVLSGGYGTNYEPPAPGAMTEIASLTVVNGSLIIENFVIR